MVAETISNPRRVIRSFILIVIIFFCATSSSADLIASNLENNGITKNDYTLATSTEKLALGFTTNNYAWLLDSITMRLRGWNYVAPVPMTTPVELFTSETNGQFNQPGTLIYSFGILSVTSLDEYNVVSQQPIYLFPNTEYWIVLTTGSFEDLYGYQGGPQIGPGYVTSPSLIFKLYSNNWEQAGNRTFAMEVQGRPLLVRIARTIPLYYSTLQDAYDDAIDGDIIQSQSAVLSEDLYIDIDKSVIIKGGYDNDYTMINGTTILNGNIAISDGTVVIENFDLEL